MAEIVGGFLLPHDPLIFQQAERADEARRNRVRAAYRRIAERVGALRADSAIVIGSDHYMLFGPTCLPQMLIVLDEAQGPLERLPGIEREEIAVDTELAAWLHMRGRDAGFDWAVAKTLTVDHAIAIPHALCIAPNRDVLTVPIYIASGVEPMIRMSRARQLGAMIRDAVRSWPVDRRVVVFGSGGMSHWVGMAEMGRVGEDFDLEVLRHVTAGDLDTLAAYQDDALLARGGNGAFELRNFVCAMAAVGSCAGKVIAYEPAPEWITGLGFAELEVR